MLGLLRTLRNIFAIADLRARLFFTLVVFAVYRLGVFIPLPGIDTTRAAGIMAEKTSTGFLAYANMFSGGALEKLSIFALGIGPYITASIVMQMMSIAIPQLEMLAKEGEYGRRKMAEYTRYLTVVLSVIHGMALAIMAERAGGIVISSGWGFRLSTTIILTISSIVVMWMGEQINAHGIGNGSSMLIFAGILARVPSATLKILEYLRSGSVSDWGMVALTLSLILALTAVIVFVESGERRIPIHYAKRVVGNRVFGGQTSYIPLKLNISGVIPVILASNMMQMVGWIVALVASKSKLVEHQVKGFFGYGTPFWLTTQALLIVLFALVYASVVFNAIEVADNLRKHGGFIPGIRPGRRTAEFFDYVLTRLTIPGSIYLAALSIAPALMDFMIVRPGGTALLIVVGVAMDLSAKVETYLIERKYEGFLPTGRMRGRRA